MKAEKTKPIRILLVDDHPIVLTGLRNALASHPPFAIVGEATNGQEAVHLAKETQPDVVLMDISLPVKNGIEATREIRKALPQTQVLVLTMHENKEYALELVQAGAQGYVLKDSPPADLITALETIHRGESYFSPSIAQMLVQELRESSRPSRRKTTSQLSDREHEVLQLLAQGFTNREVAERLSISIRTAEFHRDAIMKKLNLFTVAELTAYAIREGMLSG
ncbi:MAG: response regulator [Bacteroidota bacterium]